MGQALRRSAEDGRGRGRAAEKLSVALAFLLAVAAPGAQEPPVPRGAVRVDSARFSVIAFPQDLQLARSLLRQAVAGDTFPGLPRPLAPVVIAIAPDARRFREWTGGGAPEWGAAIAIPEARRIVLQGSHAGSSAGDPRVTVRHELAHLALHEALGDLPPRWFDEGYASFAAGEWGRDEVLTTNLALVFRGAPRLDELDREFSGGETRAQEGYALAHLAVAQLASLDAERGLTLFFRYWRETRSFDQALRRAYGLTEEGFETTWRSSTRRRYGALALVTDLTLTFLLLLLVFGPLWAIRRQRDRERMAAMRAADEAQERREREGALAALLGVGEPPPDTGNPPGSPDGPHTNDDLIK